MTTLNYITCSIVFLIFVMFAVMVASPVSV